MPTPEDQGDLDRFIAEKGDFNIVSIGEGPKIMEGWEEGEEAPPENS